MGRRKRGECERGVLPEAKRRCIERNVRGVLEGAGIQIDDEENPQVQLNEHVEVLHVDDLNAGGNDVAGGGQEQAEYAEFHSDNELSSEDEWQLSDYDEEDELVDIPIREPLDDGARDTLETTRNFRELLQEWAVEFQVKQDAVDRLLHIMKVVPNYEELGLPLTCRTLLQTIKKTPLKAVSPGHYFHFGLENGIMQVLKDLSIMNIKDNYIKMQLNVDGVPLAKSSNSQLWTILA